MLPPNSVLNFSFVLSSFLYFDGRFRILLINLYFELETDRKKLVENSTNFFIRVGEMKTGILIELSKAKLLFCQSNYNVHSVQ